MENGMGIGKDQTDIPLDVIQGRTAGQGTAHLLPHGILMQLREELIEEIDDHRVEDSLRKTHPIGQLQKNTGNVGAVLVIAQGASQSRLQRILPTNQSINVENASQPHRRSQNEN